MAVFIQWNHLLVHGHFFFLGLFLSVLLCICPVCADPNCNFFVWRRIAWIYNEIYQTILCGNELRICNIFIPCPIPNATVCRFTNSYLSFNLNVVGDVVRVHSFVPLLVFLFPSLIFWGQFHLDCHFAWSICLFIFNFCVPLSNEFSCSEKLKKCSENAEKE